MSFLRVEFIAWRDKMPWYLINYFLDLNALRAKAQKRMHLGTIALVGVWIIVFEYNKQRTMFVLFYFFFQNAHKV